jgi:signal peptidase I
VSAKENASMALVEDVVRSFGGIRLRVLGTSMAPSVLHGDVVFVQRTELEKISVGEIVLFAREGRFFVHRVVSPSSAAVAPSLVTRGDRLSHDDPPVTSSEFLGRVTLIERGDRHLKPESYANRSRSLLRHVLRASDLATRCYLRLLALARDSFSAGGECRP